MAADSRIPDKAKVRSEVAAFLDQVARLPPARQSGPKGRLIFALDATMSRQPTWDIATSLQNDMFATAAATGGLQVQLVSFRGLAGFDVRRWTDSAADLQRAMAGYRCQGGLTQIRRVLANALAEHKATAVQAMVFIGDAFEEDADRVCEAAGQLGLAGVPCFVFQEGHAAQVETLYREMARLTRGAFGRFDAGSADMLRKLLQAVAAFASGGRRALQDLSRRGGSAAQLLLTQMDKS